MATARHELGPEAMLVNSRKAPPESGHLGQYEVVFGVVESRPAARRECSAPCATGSRPTSPTQERARGDAASHDAFRFRSAGMAERAPDLSDAYAILTANEVAPELAREIVHGAEARASKASRLEAGRGQVYQRALIEELARVSRRSRDWAERTPRRASLHWSGLRGLAKPPPWSNSP